MAVLRAAAQTVRDRSRTTQRGRAARRHYCSWRSCKGRIPMKVSCTDGAVSMFGRDVRRLRSNILIGGVDGAGERQWPGATLRLPHAEVAIADLRGRCVMTTYDPDTAEQDPGVLRDIVRRFGGRLCLNAHVIRSGQVKEGDAVTLLSHAHDTQTSPPSHVQGDLE